MEGILAGFATHWRSLNLLIRGMLICCFVTGLLVPSGAQAQSTNGGWISLSGPGGTFGSADEACHAQWVDHMSIHPNSRYIGATPFENDFSFANCHWTTVQYLCPEEHGGSGAGCGTELPSYVQINCASGYTATADGHCRDGTPPPERPCDCEKDGQVNPTVGDPILVSTGAMMSRAQDYETPDGDFRIGRTYRSFQVGRAINGDELPRRQIRDLIGGWNFDFSYELQLSNFSGSPTSPSAKVAVMLPDGTGYGFVLQSSGQWAPDTALGTANTAKDLKLEYVGTLPTNLADVVTGTSAWKLTDRDDAVWTLETRAGPNGGKNFFAWPTEKVERSGYTWDFAYNSDSSLATITDSFGRVATFDWYDYYSSSLSSPPSGSLPYPLAIKSIALPDGTSLRFTYDPPPATSAPSTVMIKRLVKVERLSAASAVLDSTAYLYEDTRFPTHITGIVDNRDVRVSSFAFDNKGRAVSTEETGGANKTVVEYGTSGTSRTRRVTNALGKADNYTFTRFASNTNDYRLTGIAGEASANTAASTVSIDYGVDTYISDSDDAEGRTTTTTRDARGRATSVVEADGEPEERTTTTTWNSTFNVPDTIVRPGVTETYTYNLSGQLTGLTLTDTTSQTVPYSTNGQTRTWAYDWDANGRLLSVNGPLPDDGMGHDDLTAYDYDTDGNLLTSTDTLGHVTAYDDYDANGRPGTMTDPNGVVTSYGYDDLGRVETITVEDPGNPLLNAITTIEYDEIGQVIGLTLPSTDKLIIDYDDAKRVSSIRAASGERQDFVYDAMGNVISATVKRSNGSVSQGLSNTFDELGRLLTETLGPTGHPARQAYDKLDNVVSSTTPNGNSTTAAFDALNRVVSTVAPDAGTTALEYDGADNLLSHTDPISVTTDFVYDGFGDVIQEVSPDRGTSTYEYDKAGNVVEYTDARGQVIDYTRDYLGRITEKVPQGRPSSEIIDYYWDMGGISGSYEVGRLAKVVDGSGATKFKYDHRGNLLVKEQTIGSTTAAQLAYTYDLGDRITQIAYPSGRLVKYDYDSKGRVSAVSTKASSLVGSWTVLADNYAYEPFGPVASMDVGNGLAVENVRGSDGRLVSRRLYHTSNDSNVSYLAYSYDEDGNIASISDEVDDANSRFYGYDKMGRLSLAVVGSGSATGESLSYTSGTNQLASVTGSSGTRTISYDDRGNTDAETRPGSITASVDYDGYGRLTGYDRTDLGSSTFTYNGLDDRVTMDLPTAGTRHFIYDASGRVIGEYGSSAGDVQAEFIWALPRVDGQSMFGGDDGLGGYMPLAVTTPDSSGGIQVNWVYGGHLGVPLVTTDASGSPATTPDDYLAAGFPGQSRVFSDLYYNRYRDYDPMTGRYAQADPVGLSGGANPYEYAGENPTNNFDPQGLANCVYGILEHTLICTSIRGGTPVTLGPADVSSGTLGCTNNASASCIRANRVGPIVPGHYRMNRDSRPKHANLMFWRLEPVPMIPAIFCNSKLVRCGFELHPGQITLGCITANNAKEDIMRQYRRINELLEKEDESNYLDVFRSLKENKFNPPPVFSGPKM